MTPRDDTEAVALARQLAAEFAGRADEADKLGRLPAEDVAALQASGYLRLSVPQVYGGQGLSLRECVAAQVALAQGSAATALVAGMPMQIFGHEREARLWPEEKFEWLSRIAVEGGLINSAASEPELGSPSRGGLPATYAVADPAGDGWLINGHKTWTTGGKHLSHILVQLRIEDEPAVIVVPQEAPGVTWLETWSDSLSLRASDSHDVHFNNVLVPADHLLRGRREGGPPPPSLWFPMIMSAVYLGAALAARNAVIRFALERVPTSLGQPIATLPKIQRQIGEIDLALQAATALMFEVAGQWQGDEATRQQLYPRIAAAKYQVTEAAAFATEQALRVAGGTSITKSLPLERHFRDVRAGSMQPPSGDTALEIVGRQAIEQLRNGRA